jgi:uncharacterized membrane protein
MSRVDRMWENGRDWVVTAVMAAFGFILAIILVRLDDRLDLSPATERLWLYAGDAGSASTLLAAIAGATITVAGVIFSANFVTMQLASSQYTPRIIRSLTRKRRLQFVLGVFVGTFVYSIMVLRATSAATPEMAEFVPVISITVAMFFALASVATLVFFVHYGTMTMQPAFLIGSAAQDSLRLIAQGAPLTQVAGKPRLKYPGPIDEPSTVVTSTHWGYIQSLDPGMLGTLAANRDLIIRLEFSVGEAVLPGEALVTIWPESAGGDDVEKIVREAFTIGNERTPEQDIEFGYQRVQDIALKALSPAINDPTTARWCIDRLGEMLVILAQKPINPYRIEGAPGQDRILWEHHLFERCVDISFTQIRYYGAADPIVVEHVLNTMRRVVLLSPPDCLACVAAEAQRLRTAALAHATSDADRDRIEKAADWGSVISSPPVNMANPFAIEQQDSSLKGSPGS